jgi:hypothetical protein
MFQAQKFVVIKNIDIDQSKRHKTLPALAGGVTTLSYLNTANRVDGDNKPIGIHAAYIYNNGNEPLLFIPSSSGRPKTATEALAAFTAGITSNTCGYGMIPAGGSFNITGIGRIDAIHLVCETAGKTTDVSVIAGEA